MKVAGDFDHALTLCSLPRTSRPASALPREHAEPASLGTGTEQMLPPARAFCLPFLYTRVVTEGARVHKKLLRAPERRAKDSPHPELGSSLGKHQVPALDMQPDPKKDPPRYLHRPGQAKPLQTWAAPWGSRSAHYSHLKRNVWKAVVDPKAGVCKMTDSSSSQTPFSSNPCLHSWDQSPW